ncbi:hypothetical protein [Roseococcus pinisoli]|uniref:Uncharacterized protein n=1 Tax=Roseococcus pinisoli TaxID=2835040 RepID=A0ABS5QBW0_9PROT|nr:hypothetical protein [Roseococcus pinisoli]MBS7811174.1 hypothetical protein [Roseococcus pinisoli]
MAERATLLALAERLETCGPAWDRRNDEDIARAIGWDQDAAGEWHQVGVFFPDGALRRTSYAVELPAFTRSLDAALEQEDIVQTVRSGTIWTAVALPGHLVGIGRSEPLARRSAALRVLAAQAEGGA